MNRRDSLKVIGGFAFLPTLSWMPKTQKKKKLWSDSTGFINDRALNIVTYIDRQCFPDFGEGWRALQFPCESVLMLYGEYGSILEKLTDILRQLEDIPVSSTG